MVLLEGRPVANGPNPPLPIGRRPMRFRPVHRPAIAARIIARTAFLKSERLLIGAGRILALLLAVPADQITKVGNQRVDLVVATESLPAILRTYVDQQ